MLLGFVLGPLMEENLRRAMLMSRGDPALSQARLHPEKDFEPVGCWPARRS
jgi:hypothetical protein